MKPAPPVMRTVFCIADTPSSEFHMHGCFQQPRILQRVVLHNGMATVRKSAFRIRRLPIWNFLRISDSNFLCWKVIDKACWKTIFEISAWRTVDADFRTTFLESGFVVQTPTPRNSSY